jgi:hypothetical protein
MMVLNLTAIMNFGARFNKFGFDFKIEPRNPGESVYIANNSNKYYFYFTDPEALPANTGASWQLRQ